MAKVTLPTFEAAIFDFDGTLAATDPLWEQVDDEFLRPRGFAYTPQYGAAIQPMGFKDSAAYTRELFHLDDTVEEICAEWEQLALRIFCEKACLRKGAREYLELLKNQGVPIALATVNKGTLLDGAQHIDVEALFDVRVYGEDVSRSKHFPDIYLLAAKRLGVEPSQCMVFEDVEVAIKTAQAIPMMTCAVNSHSARQNFNELAQLATSAISHWTDLLDN